VQPGWYPELARGQQGAAALEFALVAPLFLLLWFGILDFGLAMYAKGLITNACQEGARYGAIYHLSPPSNGDIQGYVQDYLRGAGFSEPVTITVTGAGGPSGTPLTVRVDYSYQFLGLPGFLAGWADSLNLSAETVKRLE
jgi:Flp pilus assembly protein TadG